MPPSVCRISLVTNGRSHAERKSEYSYFGVKMSPIQNNTSLPDEIFCEFSESRQRRMNDLAKRTQTREKNSNKLECVRNLTPAQERDLIRLYESGGHGIFYRTRTMENLAKKCLVSHICGCTGSLGQATRFELTEFGRKVSEEILSEKQTRSKIPDIH